MPSRSRKQCSEDKSRCAENRDDGLQRMKMYYESNKESSLSSSRDKYALDSEFSRAKSGVRYADNPEPIKRHRRGIITKILSKQLQMKIQRGNMTKILSPKKKFQSKIQKGSMTKMLSPKKRRRKRIQSWRIVKIHT